MFTGQFFHKRLWYSCLLSLLLLLPTTVYAAPTLQLWRPVSDRTEGFYLKIPTEWQSLTLSKADIDLGLSMAGVQHPHLQALLNNADFQQQIADGTKFVAFDLSDRALVYDLPAHVTVIKLPMISDLPLTDLQKSIERELALLAVPDYPLQSEIGTVGAQPAVSFRYVVAHEVVLFQPQLNAVHQLVVVKDGSQYILTISVPLAAVADYQETVHTMLDSFQLLPTLQAPSGLPSTPPVLEPTPVVAIVKVARLNIRNGPGTNYPVIGGVNRNQRLRVTGRADNRCRWLQIALQGEQRGWIAGPPDYSTLEGNCSALPIVAAPAPPSPPTNPCVRFDNHFNKVADVTLTSLGNAGFSQKFNIAAHGRQTQCLVPGRYTFSVGVPGVGNVNGEFTLERGGRLLVIPIYQDFS